MFTSSNWLKQINIYFFNYVATKSFAEIQNMPYLNGHNLYLHIYYRKSYIILTSLLKLTYT